MEIDLPVKNRMELSKVETNLRRYLIMEEEFWKQKAGMKWFTQGDRSTKLFHSYIQGRGKTLHISEILIENREYLNKDEDIGATVVEFFRDVFTENNDNQDFSMLECIPINITQGENEKMIQLVECEEVKNTVF